LHDSHSVKLETVFTAGTMNVILLFFKGRVVWVRYYGHQGILNIVI